MDIVERLRHRASIAHMAFYTEPAANAKLDMVAAAEIEALRRANAELVKERDKWRWLANDIDQDGNELLWSARYSEMYQEYHWAYEAQKATAAALTKCLKGER